MEVAVPPYVPHVCLSVPFWPISPEISSYIQTSNVVEMFSLIHVNDALILEQKKPKVKVTQND